MYSNKKLDSYYFVQPGFYFFFIPVGVPYKTIYELAHAKGLKKKEAFGPILEKGKFFGKGWIGIEVNKPLESRPDVVHVQGDFHMLEHQGPYKSIGKAYRKIMREKPGAGEYFNLYLDDPEKVEASKLRTQILFR